MKYILILTSLFISVSISAKQTQPSLYEVDLNYLDSIDTSEVNYGFNKAVIDLIPIIFNKDAFNYIKTDNKYRRIDSELAIGQTVDFPIPGLNESLLLIVEKVEKFLPDRSFITYTGHAESDKTFTFKFTVDKNLVFGRLRHDNYIYFIEPNSDLNGQMTLAVIDRSLIPIDTDDVLNIRDKTRKEKIDYKSIPNKSGSNGNVRVLVKYANNVSSGENRAIDLISDFNQALRNSNVAGNNLISHAGIEQLNTDLAGLPKASVLYRMQHRMGVFSNIDEEMLLSGADLVFTIMNGPAGPDDYLYPGYSGIVGGQASEPFMDSNNPFAVSADNYLGSSADFTGIHEIGHILDGYHPSETSNPNRGYIDTSDTTAPIKYWQTVMGTYETSLCQLGGTPTCHRIQYFSNPNLSYNGSPLGNSSHYMASHLNMTMPIASNFRGAPLPPPVTPNNLSVTSAQCHGHNFISWNSVSDADSYHLYRVNGSNNLVSLYSGTYTSHIFINVTSGTWPLKVKACNAAGCSSLSTKKNANYVNYCM